MPKGASLSLPLPRSSACRVPACRTSSPAAAGIGSTREEGQMMPHPDLADLDDASLAQLRVDILTEIERRETIASAPERMDRIARDYLGASGTSEGEAWVQPTSAVDAYPQGWIVTHNGKTWEALTPACVWEPGVSGWREVTEEGEGPAEWVAPTGAHDAYQTGDRVTFDGQVYESTIDGNVWSPADHPAGWTQID